MESAEMDPCLSPGHTIEDAEFSKCVSGTPDAFCSAAEQAQNFKGYVVADDMAAADSRDSFGTVDYTREDTAGAFADFETAKLTQHLALNGTADDAEGMGTQTAPIPTSAKMPIEPTPGTVNARQKSRSPQIFGLTSVHLSLQFGFRDATLWCWKCGGWSAGSRRASRLKKPCGVPSKTGADVVHRVSGG